MKKRLFGLILLVSFGMDILGSHRVLRRALPLAKAASNLAPVNVYAQAKPLRVVASAASSYFQIKNYNSHSVVKADEYLEKAANDSCDFKTFSRVEIVELAKRKNKEFIEDLEFKRISDGTACNLSEVFRNHPIFTEVILPTTPGYYLWKFFGVESDFTKMIDHLSELDVCMQTDILNNTINLIGKNGDLSDEDVFISLLNILSILNFVDTPFVKTFNSTIVGLLHSYAHKLKDFSKEVTHEIISSLLYLESNDELCGFKFIKYLNQDFGLSYFSKKLCINDDELKFYFSFEENFLIKDLKNQSYSFIDKCFEYMPDEKYNYMFNKCFPDCKKSPHDIGAKPSTLLARRELEQIDFLKRSCDSYEDREFLGNLSKQFSEFVDYGCKHNKGVGGPLDVKKLLDDFYKINQLANLFESVSDGNLSKVHFNKYVGDELKQTVARLKKKPMDVKNHIDWGNGGAIIWFIDSIGGVVEFEKIMHKESDLIDSEYVTFYHGQAAEYGYQIEMRKCLSNVLSEHGLAKKIRTDFVPIQSCPVAYSLDEELCTSKIIDAVDEHETLMVGDYNTCSRPSHLLSVNIFLFGRLETESSCTVKYVIGGHNVRDIDVGLYNNVFKDLGVSNYIYRKYESEIEDLMILYKKSYGSNLLQIAVPKDKVEDWVYLSDFGASKKVDHEVNKFIEIVDEFGYMDLDDFSECAMPLTSAYMLNPDSGVKIFNYPVVRNATKADELKETMEDLISRMVADMRD